MIGCGSMGGGMALLFAEKGIKVLLQDPSGRCSGFLGCCFMAIHSREAMLRKLSQGWER